MHILTHNTEIYINALSNIRTKTVKHFDLAFVFITV